MAARLIGLLLVVVAGWFVGHNSSQSGLAEMLARFWFIPSALLGFIIMYAGARDFRDNNDSYVRPSRYISFPRLALGITGVAACLLFSHFALFVGILTQTS